MRLFRMECRKTAGSILYGVVVLALLAVSLSQYEPVVESELKRADDPDSVFYTAADGVYAEERDSVPDEAAKRAMMTGAVNRLIDNYRSNCYEYYPFGYVKEKKLSARQQAAVLQYLTELTGLGEAILNGTAEKTADKTDGTYIGDVPVSGGGAFVLEPGGGDMNGNGQFVVEPDEWKYVPGDGASTETAENGGASTETPENGSVSTETPESGAASSETSPRPDGGFEIQVPFERFMEIMGQVDGLIGHNSYFSQTMLSLYYFGNDMEDAPVTERQHREFYEGDRVTGAFARYYCDSLSLAVLFLPAFVIVDLMLRDRRRNMRGLIYVRTIASAKLICARYAAAVCMVMLPVLLLPAKSLFVLMRFCGGMGVRADALAFVKYTLAWILPAVLLIMAISLLVTVLLENYTAILLTGVIWLAARPSLDKMAGGNYGLFDIIIRHNTLKGYGRMMENIQMLVLNRIMVSVAALVLVGLSVLAYSMKRKGGLSFGTQKPAHYHGFKFPPER